MVIKNLENLVAECVTYADEINRNPDIYPKDARMPLRDLLRYDMVLFLGYLYEPGNRNVEDQVSFIQKNLHMIITTDKFIEFTEQKCQNPRDLNVVPRSLGYFMQADQADTLPRDDRKIAKSKFAVNAFRRIGEGFLNYPDVQPETRKILDSYIQFLNSGLIRAGITEDPAEKERAAAAAKAAAAEPEPSMTRATETDDGSMHMKTGKDTNKITKFDARTGKFEVKSAISTSGYHIMKKGKTDVSEFSNFMRDQENPNEGISRGKGKVGGNRKDEESDEYEKSLDELIVDLKNLIGLDSVKKDVLHLINIIKIRKLREMKHLKQVEMSFHLVFTGNPGTGKTTVARLLAKIYKQLGLVSKGQFIEVDRSGLVDHFPGGTAIKTTNVINKAIGGILFIDEAYTLTRKKDSGDYGQEAVDTLLKRMEDDRDDLIVIVAGYPEPMKDFIESNPGLKSRFNKFIEFPDYSSDDLMEIFRLMCRENDYQMSEGAAFVAETYLRGIAEGKTENFANARLVRNYFERCVDRQATRLVADSGIDVEDLITFVREDMVESPTVAAAALPPSAEGTEDTH